MTRTPTSASARPRPARARFAAGFLVGALFALPIVATTTFFVGTAASQRLDPAPAAQPMVAVNRAGKSARLPLAASIGAQAPAEVLTLGKAATSVVSKGIDERAMRPRTNAIPRGCLSAVGGLDGDKVAQDHAICVADISTIN